MKSSILMFFILLASVHSLASVKEDAVGIIFRPGVFDFNNRKLCPISACAADDEGKTYTRESNSLRRSPHADHSPWVQLALEVEMLEGEKKTYCFCRCDMADEMAARELK